MSTLNNNLKYAFYAAAVIYTAKKAYENPNEVQKKLDSQTVKLLSCMSFLYGLSYTGDKTSGKLKKVLEFIHPLARDFIISIPRTFAIEHTIKDSSSLIAYALNRSGHITEEEIPSTKLSVETKLKKLVAAYNVLVILHAIYNSKKGKS